jgi:hypothetical protein
MILTESEAKSRACPFIDIKGCIGARCMAWREVVPGSQAITTTFRTSLVGEAAFQAEASGAEQIKITENEIVWKHTTGRFKEGTGYCGAAGIPPQLQSVKKITESKIDKTEKTIVKNDRGEAFDIDEMRRLSGK